MRELVIVVISIFLVLPAYPKDKPSKDYVPNVFIYTIPDDEDDAEGEIGKNELNTNTVVKAPVLKTEIQYFDNLDVVTFDASQNPKKINISKPQKISAVSNQARTLSNRSLKMPYRPVKAAYKTSEESWISDYSKSYEEKIGAFSIGSNYSKSLSSLSTLEYSSGLFTKYHKNNFTLVTEFSKEQSPVSGYTGDTFSLAPEYRFNKSLALKNVLTTNLTTNRKTAELILLLTPFAFKNNDRFNVELSAGQTYDEDNSVLKSKFKFNTSFKL